MRKQIPIENRFWKYVEKTPTCWLWTGSNAKGYGVISNHRNGIKKQEYAHRLSYEFSNGKIKKGMYVLHKCDTPSCVNPEHLFIGTQIDNMKDAKNKNRIKKGADHWNCILSEQQVKEIRNSYKKGIRGFGCISLSKKFNVCPVAIFKIIKRKSWRHVS